MRLLNFKKTFSVRLPHKASAPQAAAQRYLLTITCLAPERERVVDLLMFYLTPLGLAPQQIRHENSESGRLAQTIASVVCAPAERAALVRFVNAAGLLPGVRSVRWESVPQAEAVALH